MAESTDLTPVEQPHYDTPFDSQDRGGKKAPNGPVDPVLVWAKAKARVGLTRLATDDQMSLIKNEYGKLCKEIVEKGDAAVVGEREDPNTVAHRWDWRQDEQRHNGDAPTERPHNDSPYLASQDVLLGNNGQALLGIERREPTEAA